MVDHHTANARLASFTTFMGGIVVITLLLSINILSARDKTLGTLGLVAEAVNIVFLLASITILFIALPTLVSAYFENGVDVAEGVRRARRALVTAVFLIFWAISGLLLVAFDFTPRAIAYATAAFVAPVVFLFVRQRQSISL